MFTNSSMIDSQIFHIYEKATNEPVKVCLTTDELEKLLAERKIDWKHWEIERCIVEKEYSDASY